MTRIGPQNTFFHIFYLFWLILTTVESFWLDCSQNESKSIENVEKSILGPYSCHKTVGSIPPDVLERLWGLSDTFLTKNPLFWAKNGKKSNFSTFFLKEWPKIDFWKVRADENHKKSGPAILWFWAGYIPNKTPLVWFRNINLWLRTVKAGVTLGHAVV